MRLFRNEIQVVEKHVTKPVQVKIKSLNGHDAIRENADEGNTF